MSAESQIAICESVKHIYAEMTKCNPFNKKLNKSNWNWIENWGSKILILKKFSLIITNVQVPDV